MGASCFVISPISTPPELLDRYAGDAEHFVHVIEHLLVPAVERAGFTPHPPIAKGSDLIHAEIVRMLESSDVVLCDMSALNPNVFFELGIRTAVNKPICLVRDSYTKTIPFDTGILNAHTYDPSLVPWVLEDQIAAMATHLSESASRSEGQNTLWRYFGLTTRGSMKSIDESTLDDKIDFLLAEVATLARPDRPVVHTQADAMTRLMSVVLNQSRRRRISLTDLYDALGRLDASEREVIGLRFGLDGTGLRTLTQVGEEVGLPAKRVRAIEARAIAQLAERYVDDYEVGQSSRESSPKES